MHVHINKSKTHDLALGAEIDSSTNEVTATLSQTGGRDAHQIQTKSPWPQMERRVDSWRRLFVLFSFDEKAVETWTIIVQGPGRSVFQYRLAICFPRMVRDYVRDPPQHNHKRPPGRFFFLKMFFFKKKNGPPGSLLAPSQAK